MEDDDDMRRIMVPVLSNFFTHVDVKKVTPDLFVSYSHQTKDFFQNLITVLSAKKILIYSRWENFCAASCFNALSTHEMYLRYVMFACKIEIRFSNNIFEKLLGAFALVINFNNETLINSGVDFCELSVDIFIVFYKRILRESFHMQGGLQQFAEYLRCHEYLPWRNYMRNELEVSNLHIAKGQSFLKKLYHKTEKEIEKVPYHPNFIKHSDIIEDLNSESLAKEVLSTTKIKLPKLTNSDDLNARLQDARQQKVAVRTACSKVQTFTANSELTAESSKRETTGIPSKREITDTILKRETMNTALKSETTAESSKRETMGIPSKGEITDTILKRETMITASNSELKAESSKGEITDTILKRETMSTALKCKTSDSCPKRETTVASPKRETTSASCIHEMADPISIRNASEPAYKGETTERVSKGTPMETLPKYETKDPVLQQSSNLETVSQTNNAVDQRSHFDWCENIVRNVIKYNDSKCSDPADSNNQIQREANEFLGQLKDMIRTLIDALDDCEVE